MKETTLVWPQVTMELTLKNLQQVLAVRDVFGYVRQGGKTLKFLFS